MPKRLRIEQAGRLLWYQLTDDRGTQLAGKSRAPRRDRTAAPQQALNQRRSFLMLEKILACNFPTPGSGLVVTLTYDDAHMPKTREAARRKFNRYIGKLRCARADAGLPELVAVSCVEVLTSDSGRWHHHAVINNTGRDIELIRACWSYGSDIEVRPLRVDSEKNHETLARYMSKEAREVQDFESKVGSRVWTCTRNAKRPEADVMSVPDDYEIAVPEGAEILSDEEHRTDFGSWRIVKVRVGSDEPVVRPRARRKRRPRA